MAGEQPLEQTRDLPGAFPETPGASGNQSLSVNPIPATGGLGNPIQLAPGEPVPDPSTITGNTVESTVRTDRDSYEDSDAIVPAVPAATSPSSGYYGRPPASSSQSANFGRPPSTSHVVPETLAPTMASVAPGASTTAMAGEQKLEERGVPTTDHRYDDQPERDATEAAASEQPKDESAYGRFAGIVAAGAGLFGIGAYSASEAHASSSSVGPDSTTAALAGQQPLEERGVPSVVSKSQRDANESPEASANPEAVEEKEQMEDELKKSVPEEKPTSESGVFGRSENGMSGQIAAGAAAAGVGLAGAGFAANQMIKDKTNVDPASTLPKAAQDAMNEKAKESSIPAAAGVSTTDDTSSSFPSADPKSLDGSVGLPATGTGGSGLTFANKDLGAKSEATPVTIPAVQAPPRGEGTGLTFANEDLGAKSETTPVGIPAATESSTVQSGSSTVGTEGSGLTMANKDESPKTIPAKTEESAAGKGDGLTFAEGAAGAGAVAGAGLVGGGLAAASQITPSTREAPSVDKSTSENMTTSEQTTSSTVPQEVLDSMDKSSADREAAANPDAVEKKSEFEQSLLRKVPESNAKGEAAPTSGGPEQVASPMSTTTASLGDESLDKPADGRDAALAGAGVAGAGLVGAGALGAGSTATSTVVPTSTIQPVLSSDGASTVVPTSTIKPIVSRDGESTVVPTSTIQSISSKDETNVTSDKTAELANAALDRSGDMGANAQLAGAGLSSTITPGTSSVTAPAAPASGGAMFIRPEAYARESETLLDKAAVGASSSVASKAATTSQPPALASTAAHTMPASASPPTALKAARTAFSGSHSRTTSTTAAPTTTSDGLNAPATSEAQPLATSKQETSDVTVLGGPQETKTQTEPKVSSGVASSSTASTSTPTKQKRQSMGNAFREKKESTPGSTKTTGTSGTAETTDSKKDKRRSFLGRVKDKLKSL